MQKDADFLQLYDNAAPEDKLLLDRYFAELSSLISLPQKYKRAMLADARAALAYYHSINLPVKTALERIKSEKLGTFYCEEPTEWFPLDNAAKVYPLSMRKTWMAIFRLSFYLTEPVVPALLQLALTFTVKRFPVFATTIKTGIFWNYIDSSRRRFAIKPETKTPCMPLNVSTNSAKAFRVVYFENRVSLECFHILTDGLGGTVFLKTLIAEYLRLLGKEIPCTHGVLDISALPLPQEQENAFKKMTKTSLGQGFVGKSSAQMRGKLAKFRPAQILHFDFDITELKEAAKNNDATITALLLAIMFVASKKATDKTNKSIKIQVPVNMRKYIPSQTLRNFSMYCSIDLPYEQIYDVRSILPLIREQLIQKGSREEMEIMMTAATQLVSLLKNVPMIIKKPIAGLVYGILGDRMFSSTLSNLGIVLVPREMRQYIEKMDFVLASSTLNRAACSFVTIGSTSTFSITKTTDDPCFENEFFSVCRSLGLNVNVSGSYKYASKDCLSKG